MMVRKRKIKRKRGRWFTDGGIGARGGVGDDEREDGAEEWSHRGGGVIADTRETGRHGRRREWQALARGGSACGPARWQPHT